ncbi:MAG: hypothetical protein M5U26_27310 [Planctomycetota bacterium]|nr:hypothetical protein [Planctomycetota bacterium]
MHELLPALKLSGGPERLAPLDAEGAAFELAFEVSPRARAGALDREILVRDFDGRELGRIPLRASVRAMALIVDERLDFGVLEPGDLAERDLVWTATAPADILDALPPPRLAAAADRPEEAAVEAAAAPRARLS